MAEIIDLRVERAFRTSGIKDRSLLQDIIDQGYDPNNPVDLNNYNEWKKFESVIFTDVEHNWTDEALERLYTDIKLCDPTQVYNIDTTTGYIDFGISDLELDIDLDLDDK